MTELPATATDRARAYHWDDPLDLAAAASRMSGLEFLTAYAEGRLPEPRGLVTNGIRPVEFADSALGCAVHTKLEVGVGYTSLELKINFTRAVNVASGVLRRVGSVVTIGRRGG